MNVGITDRIWSAVRYSFIFRQNKVGQDEKVLYLQRKVLFEFG